jgi:hypothetical protein
MLSKETGVTFCGLVLVVDVLDAALAHQPLLRMPQIAVLIAVVLCGAAYSAVRVILMATSSDWSGATLDGSGLLRITENPFAFLRGLPRRMSVSYLHARYLWLLLWPENLSAEYSYNCIPAVVDVYDLRNLYSAAALVSVIGTAVTLAVIRKHEPLALYVQATASAIAWGIVPFLPASMLFTTVGTLLAERLLYIPSVGFCVLCAIIVDIALGLHVRKGSTRSLQRQLIIFALCFLALGAMARRTWARGEDWRTDATLFASALRVCPSSSKLNLLYGQLLLNSHNLTGARHYFEAAYHIHPEYCDLDLQLGLLELVEGRVQNATRILVRNLHCVYTANKALPILEKLWSHRLQDDRNRVEVQRLIVSHHPFTRELRLIWRLLTRWRP